MSSAYDKEKKKHNDEAVARKKAKKAAIRQKILNAYQNLILGHKVPWTVDGNKVTDSKGNVTVLTEKEIGEITAKIEEIKQKRASKTQAPVT